MKTFAVIMASGIDLGFQKENLTAFAAANGISADTLEVIAIEGDPAVTELEDAVEELRRICEGADLVLLPGNDSGGGLAVRLAAAAGGTPVTDAVAIDPERAVASKKVYAGNLIADYRLKRRPWCISAEKTFRAPDEIGDRRNKSIELERFLDKNTNFCDKIVRMDETPSGLSDADFVIASGQGLGRASQVEQVMRTAEAAGAEHGASRPVVMNGWAPMGSLIGVSGSIVRPSVCITAAASGAPAFFAGIAGSGTIIAINSDERAPIMRKADVAVTGDACAVMEALGRLLRKE